MELKAMPDPSRIRKNPFYERIMKEGFTIKEYYSPEDIKNIKKGNLARRIDIDVLDGRTSGNGNIIGELMVNFILGLKGKTEYIINQIQPGDIYLVPEQYSLQAERDILAKTRADIVNVLTFKRLAYKVIAKAPVKNKIPLDETSRFMIITALLRRNRAKLSYYKKAKITPGFAEKLANTFKELSNQEIVNPPLPQGTLAHKTADILFLYEKYLEFTSANYISTEETMDILAELIPTNPFFKNTSVYMDNFHSFTLKEYKVIQALFAAVPTTVTILTDKDESPEDETDLFYTPKLTLGRLKKLAIARNVPVKTTYLKNPTSSSAASLSVEEAFRQGRTLPINPIKVKGNIYDEVEHMASLIIRELAVKTPLDIAVLAPEAYHTPIKSIFTEAGIPFFLDKTSPIDHNPLPRLFIAILNILITNYSSESVFSLLKTGLAPFTEEETDRLENFAMAYGIKNYKWLKPWTYKDDNTDEMNRLRERLLDFTEPFHKVFKEGDIKTVATVFYTTLEERGITENIKDIEYWEKLKHIFELMVEFLGQEKVGPKEFKEILESGLQSSPLGQVPVRGIIVADLHRSRLPKIKTLYVPGINHYSPPMENTLYTDKEKALLNSYGMEIQTTYAKLFEDNFKLYNLFSKSEKIVCSYFSSTLTGKPAPGPKLFVKFAESKENQEIITNPGFMIKDAALALNEFFLTKTIKDIYLKLYQWYNVESSNVHKEILNSIWKNEKKPVNLSTDSAKNLYGSVINASVSRLEEYARCPFSYFAKYNLKAKERRSNQLTYLDIGNIFHGIIEEFTESTHLLPLSKEESTAWVELISEKIKPNYPVENYPQKFTWERIKTIAATSLWVMSRQFSEGDFLLYAREFAFTDPVIIDIDYEKSFALTGKIDRIDILRDEDKTYLKITDYKSSQKDFNTEDIYSGVQLQLIIYLNALMQRGDFENPQPGGLFYFKMDDPLTPTDQDLINNFKMTGLVLNDPLVMNAIEKTSKILPGKNYRLNKEDFDRLISAACESIKNLGSKLTKGYIAPEPYKKNTVCSVCKYRTMCYN